MQKMTISDGLAHDLEQLQARVRGFLPDIAVVEDQELRLTLMVYAYLVITNLVPWTAKVEALTSSPDARTICHNILKAKVNDNHSALLERLVCGLSLGKINLYVVSRWFRLGDGNKAAETISEKVNASSVYGLMLLAAWESASLVFIPWMKQSADRLGIEDREYFYVHGVGAERAEAFVQATAAEMIVKPVMARFYTEKALNDVAILLRTIFARDLLCLL